MNSFAIYDTSIGYLRIEHMDQRVTKLQILTNKPTLFGKADNFTERVYKQIVEYLRGERKIFDIEVDISTSTPFQQIVLKELQKIPYGESRTYKEIATAIGNPKASRAVGMANNRNPIVIIIPCHRVIGANGSLVGYASGIDNKRHLLDLEGCHYRQ